MIKLSYINFERVVTRAMSVPVKLKDIVDALDIQNDEILHYLDKNTGEIVMITREELGAVEEGATAEEYLDWQQEMFKVAQAIVEDEAGQYLELPTQFDVNEYAIMEKFCLSLSDAEISNEMYYAIKGSGAFRRFKDKIHQYGIAEDWYKYRDGVTEKPSLLYKLRFWAMITRYHHQRLSYEFSDCRYAGAVENRQAWGRASGQYASDPGYGGRHVQRGRHRRRDRLAVPQLVPG